MANYRTPGVYVEEISTLPPSVAEVATAVPAFIGYTRTGPADTAEPKVERVTTMLEYESAFGGPPTSQFEITQPVDDKGHPTADASASQVPPTTAFSLYYALSHYFRNGGGPCYVVSVGNYAAKPGSARFLSGLAALEMEDEPTLIVLTEAACVLSPADYYGVCGAALVQCRNLGDRFTILDVARKDAKTDVDAFRNNANLSANLMYGAAYHPYLQTSIVYAYDDADVAVKRVAPAGSSFTAPPGETLETIKSSDTALYNHARTLLEGQRVVLPPSAAMAGIYARVDRERGVWKTPANVGVLAVLGPVAKITDDDQDRLNVDPTAGKSVNAIRAFTGKGTLVWGGRTLAGNDNEWRYVSVRRLFITIEESTKKASAFAVFEPNDQSTWLKVKAMIESYLYGLWEQGALAGSKPEAAYYVHVGLGTTMTPQDVLEGRMIVEIGVAAVRPAEFIVLRFSHKLQTA